MEIQKIHGDLCHETLRDNLKQKLAFDPQKDFDSQRKAVKEKLVELLGLENVVQNKAQDSLFKIEEIVECDGYTRTRFLFQSEVDSFVPCYILIPNTKKEKYPLAITMQGHTSGFHNSIGVPSDTNNNMEFIENNSYAVQAVKQGFAALAIEQRCFGERRSFRHGWEHMCEFPSLNAIMLGRTTIAERIFDISCAIDQMANFPQVDQNKIFITGHSGGGTVSFYTACLEDRISFTIPSCAFCSYKSSIMDIYHCACNYIPNVYSWFEIHDIAVLLAPKHVCFVAGGVDKIFPIEGVKDSFKVVEKIYEKANAKDNCSLVISDKAHYWCNDIVWKEVKKITDKLGWF